MERTVRNSIKAAGLVLRLTVGKAVGAREAISCGGHGNAAAPRRSLKRQGSIGCFVLLCGLWAASTVCAGTLTGPITGGSHGFPFAAPGAAVDLSQLSYVEEEFFIEGLADSYAKVGTWTRDGFWNAAPVPGGSKPFKTRLLVVRPAGSTAFNGTVVVEWMNVSSGWDNAEVFAHARAELLRGGYAWVGVSAQAVGVQLSPFSLKAWDPARYGSLAHPGDAYAYNIFTQAGQAVRAPNGAFLLDGLAVRRVIATGHSQSANGLATYVNAVHPLANVYDGFLLHSRGVAALPLSTGAGGAVPAASIVRTDVTARVIAVQDEWSIAVPVAWLMRQADGPNFRLWEVTGTGHVDHNLLANTSPIVLRDLGFPSPVCVARTNEAPLRYVLNLAINRLDAWIANATPPPHAPSFIEVVGGAIVRDVHGNARGGVRLPHLDVPNATFAGVGNAGPSPCDVAGITIPFDTPTLSSLYPNHGAYVSRFAKATNDLRGAGFLLDADANDAKTRAAESATGQ